MFLQDAISQLNQLNISIEKYKKMLKHFPSGNLQCFKNGKYIKAYCQNSKGKKYLAKKDSALVEKLALKKYYESRLHDCLREKELFETFLKEANKLNSEVEKLLAPDSNYHHLLSQVLISDSWAKMPYEQNPYKREDLIHNTFSGIKVRSKSEEIIANSLFTNNIPFRYESPLLLNGSLIYPDFTIKNPKSNTFTYWEHLGLMDNKSYKDHAMNKISNYCDNGIFPDVNLILTYETQKHPLDSNWVQQIINRNFM